MELTTFPYVVGKESLYQNSRKERIKDKHIYVYIYICTEILFQLINEDSKLLFVNISIINERCESNQLQVEKKNGIFIDQIIHSIIV